jgi:hypothetical protein
MNTRRRRSKTSSRRENDPEKNRRRENDPEKNRARTISCQKQAPLASELRHFFPY